MFTILEKGDIQTFAKDAFLQVADLKPVVVFG